MSEMHCPRCGKKAISICKAHGEFSCSDGHFWFMQDGRRKEGMLVGHHSFECFGSAESTNDDLHQRIMLRDRDAIYAAALKSSKEITGVKP